MNLVWGQRRHEEGARGDSRAKSVQMREGNVCAGGSRGGRYGVAVCGCVELRGWKVRIPSKWTRVGSGRSVSARDLGQRDGHRCHNRNFLPTTQTNKERELCSNQPGHQFCLLWGFKNHRNQPKTIHLEKAKQGRTLNRVKIPMNSMVNVSN